MGEVAAGSRVLGANGPDACAAIGTSRAPRRRRAARTAAAAAEFLAPASSIMPRYDALPARASAARAGGTPMLAPIASRRMAGLGRAPCASSALSLPRQVVPPAGAKWRSAVSFSEEPVASGHKLPYKLAPTHFDNTLCTGGEAVHLDMYGRPFLVDNSARNTELLDVAFMVFVCISGGVLAYGCGQFMRGERKPADQ